MKFAFNIFKLSQSPTIRFLWKLSRFSYKMRCHKMHVYVFTNCRSLALNEIGLGKGDSVVLSAENKPLIALVQSSITDISETSVSIYADR